jgi:hypothetical protein
VNVIIYWKTGDYADVYNVDEVRTPTPEEPYLRTIKKLRRDGAASDGADAGSGEFETARFSADEIRGHQIFLTLDDVRRGYRP